MTGKENELKTSLQKILSSYVPTGTASLLVDWLIDHRILLKITRRRKSILGNYYHPNRTRGHVITINEDLNKFAFLITLVHEFAHLTNWLKHRNTVQPHGIEWKEEFQTLMFPFLKPEILPADVMQALEVYLKNPLASSCSDLQLIRVLKRHDNNSLQLVEELPHNSIFKFGKRSFRKGEKIRTRFKCVELASGKTFLFSPVAEVSGILE